MTIEGATTSEPMSQTELEALARFRSDIRRYLRFSEETVREHGVTPQQYQLLLALKGSSGHEWSNMWQLAERLLLDHQDVVELVGSASEQGLVSSAPGSTVPTEERVQLSPDGATILSELGALHRDELRRMGSAFVPPNWNGAPATIRDRVVDEAQDAIIYADREGTIRLWNAGAQEIFGYSESEAVGRSLDLIVPEKQRKRHWDGWERVMATGESKYGSRDVLAVPALHADGTRISLEFSIAMHRGADGRIAGISAILRDVTKRWHADRELRSRLRELEKEQAAPPRS
jgi:PAS domain S-box-containing protein